jgi:6-phosphogluconolactonase
MTFQYNAGRGTLEELQTLSSLPEGFTGRNSTAEIAVHPNSRFVYASNRGHDSIAIFRIDPGKGTLAPVAHVSTQGKTPRNFSIDPGGNYLLAANQDSGTVAVFRINQETGGLTPTGTELQVSSPVCVVFAKVR